MYILVYDKNLYDNLISNGKKCVAQTQDINGVTIWTFEYDGKETFESKDGYIISDTLRMNF